MSHETLFRAMLVDHARAPQRWKGWACLGIAAIVAWMFWGVALGDEQRGVVSMETLPALTVDEVTLYRPGVLEMAKAGAHPQLRIAALGDGLSSWYPRQSFRERLSKELASIEIDGVSWDVPVSPQARACGSNQNCSNRIARSCADVGSVPQGLVHLEQSNLCIDGSYSGSCSGTCANGIEVVVSCGCG